MSALKRSGQIQKTCQYGANQHLRQLEGVRLDHHELDNEPFEQFARYLVNLCMVTQMVSTGIMESVLLSMGKNDGIFLEMNIANFIVCGSIYTAVWIYRRPLTLLLGNVPGRLGQLVCTLYWSHELADALLAGDSISVACDRFSVNPALRRSKQLLDNLVWSARQGYIDVDGDELAEAPAPLRECLRDGFMTGFLADYLYTCSDDLLKECKDTISISLSRTAKIILLGIVVLLLSIILTPYNWTWLI